MATAVGFASIGYLKLSSRSDKCPKFAVKACSSVPLSSSNNQNTKFTVQTGTKAREFRLFNSVELDQFITSADEEDEMSDGFFEAIEELERMTREPSDILEELNDRLSARELQLVLVYFSQEGRDSWCALEVFEWLKKENKVDQETMELMVSIMCGWINKLIEGEHGVGDVVDLLVDMDCVGLKPNFSMMEKVISVYWDVGKKEQAVLFVEEILKRGITCVDENGDGHKGGPTGYLVWRIMEEGNYRDAVKLAIQLRESGQKPDIYTYLIAMTAVLKELNEVSKAFRKLKGFARSGLVSELDEESLALLEKYQSDVLSEGIQLSSWVIQDGAASVYGLVHEKLLAMYICAGRGPEAEKQLWELKLIGKKVDRYFYDVVVAICASQREDGAVSRLLTTLEATSSTQKKKTLSWLLRGYIKGGNYKDAAGTILRMLDLGLRPDYVDRLAVLQGIRKRIQQTGNLETYLMLCKRLSDVELIGPCLIYVYKKKYNMWTINMI